jgi:hypothetical protein
MPRVAWAGVPPLTAGLFWQIILEVISFTISLVEVVSSVKNSLDLGVVAPCNDRISPAPPPHVAAFSVQGPFFY